MIVIIDYNMGNTGSIVNMLKTVGAKAMISSNPKEIEQADKLILPGVGAFDKAMTNLKELEIIPLLNQKVVQQKTPILGICLGAQLLANSSEEGVLPGLGWIDAQVKRFRFEPSQTHLKIPHMGWNLIKIKKESLLLKNLEINSRFYFVHSYHIVCKNSEDVLTETFHGYDFTSSVQKGNILGVQFHPEKSHKFGLKLLKNFVEYF
jgi:imidazole glycerol-phosphate synthase subunit HisH